MACWLHEHVWCLRMDAIVADEQVTTPLRCETNKRNECMLFHTVRPDEWMYERTLMCVNVALSVGASCTQHVIFIMYFFPSHSHSHFSVQFNSKQFTSTILASVRAFMHKSYIWCRSASCDLADTTRKNNNNKDTRITKSEVETWIGWVWRNFGI